MIKVAVVYHIWPHYREAVMRAMDANDRIAYDFYGSGEAFDGIKHADLDAVSTFIRAPFRKFGPFTWQPMALSVGMSSTYDAVIYLGDIHFLSTWVSAAIARLRGVPVLFWAHGWLRREHGIKQLPRNMFYRLANRILVYGERARQIGETSRFPRDRISVVYNSLDTTRADDIVSRIESGDLNSANPRQLFAHSDRPLLICTARLTELCRFDLLLLAASKLRGHGMPVNVLLVGDGPQRMALEQMAQDMSLDVHFYGCCYDEEIIGQFIYHADLTVSPGKIGLTAMHSLMYGTPAITHDDFDKQMPEVEAIQPEGTGAFFNHGDASSLADTIGKWLLSAMDRQSTRATCRAVIADKWNPQRQAAIIENAINREIGHA